MLLYYLIIIPNDLLLFYGVYLSYISRDIPFYYNQWDHYGSRIMRFYLIYTVIIDFIYLCYLHILINFILD
uniref:Uncharacterized protein n=1 Tax=Aphis citricidus picorna-like virus TaxID=2788947 RepID=A0A7S8IX76_9VIRU|nr:hypothetical protein [Aphis citricidus picorna-like virus]